MDDDGRLAMTKAHMAYGQVSLKMAYIFLKDTYIYTGLLNILKEYHNYQFNMPLHLIFVNIHRNLFLLKKIFLLVFL